MAYGGPDKLDDVEPYLLDVRGYRETPRHIIEEVEHRYELIGGRSPIRERTEAQARALGEALEGREGSYQVFVGMRHWHPFLDQALEEIRSAELDRIVGLVLAPHYSQMSVEAYFERLQSAIEDQNAPVRVAPIESWNLAAGYLDTIEDNIRARLEEFESHKASAVHLVFTAHSLPERILDWNDRYPGELEATFDELRRRFPDNPSHFAYQSAAMTPEPWLGPDAGDLMVRLLEKGEASAFLVVPIGFVSEHVEILYDIDIDFKRRVETAGGELRRIEMPGSAGAMMASLAELVEQRAKSEGWL